MARQDYLLNILSSTLKKALINFSKNNKKLMKKGHSPVTRVKKSEPNIESPDWVIWAAWADRITFEEIKEKTGIAESGVIKTKQVPVGNFSFFFE